jgi:hypothetical protein
MVGVDVGERMRGQAAVAELAQDAALGLARTGVHEDVADEVHVDRIPRSPPQLEDAFGQLSHVRLPVIVIMRDAAPS